MSTATAPRSAAAQLRLPNFEGFRIHTARIAFGGALELSLTNEDDIALVEAMKLGRELTVTLAVDGHEREVVLGGRVTRRAHRFRKEEGDETTVTDYRVTINHQQGEDEGELEGE